MNRTITTGEKAIMNAIDSLNGRLTRSGTIVIESDDELDEFACNFEVKTEVKSELLRKRTIDELDEVVFDYPESPTEIAPERIPWNTSAMGIYEQGHYVANVNLPRAGICTRINVPRLPLRCKFVIPLMYSTYFKLEPGEVCSWTRYVDVIPNADQEDQFVLNEARNRLLLRPRIDANRWLVWEPEHLYIGLHSVSKPAGLKDADRVDCQFYLWHIK